MNPVSIRCFSRDKEIKINFTNTEEEVRLMSQSITELFEQVAKRAKESGKSLPEVLAEITAEGQKPAPATTTINGREGPLMVWNGVAHVRNPGLPPPPPPPYNPVVPGYVGGCHVPTPTVAPPPPTAQRPNADSNFVPSPSVAMVSQRPSMSIPYIPIRNMTPPAYQQRVGTFDMPPPSPQAVDADGGRPMTVEEIALVQASRRAPGGAIVLAPHTATMLVPPSQSSTPEDAARADQIRKAQEAAQNPKL